MHRASAIRSAPWAVAVSGLAAGAIACGVLLGIDDVTYEAGDAAATGDAVGGDSGAVDAMGADAGSFGLPILLASDDGGAMTLASDPDSLYWGGLAPDTTRDRVRQLSKDGGAWTLVP